ncbi:class I SAM-dependent methyltransferase [Pontiella agarivorans]|uniref:Methyltransferase domain-containing protein n=1 Tax=Pontiella agarivorans TaxID=3038953 RepID=A0ABU5MVT1_9BACT|nr:methyltransferase domain-containing protein [Pontiella agarivorans]MDZ8118232.1 methyltransferase domain-containing protein [Pontiella agarivorans]
MNKHEQEIIDQFSKQAIPFTQVPGHLDAMQQLVELSGVSKTDGVLDVACGPGMVACEFAKLADRVEGIDLVEQMIEQARLRQVQEGLGNIAWKTGSVDALPYADDAFSIVITRYSFHHFLNPRAVLAEMVRVCRPGGTVLVADVSMPEDQVEAFNQMERLRDPSHTAALSDSAWAELLGDSGLSDLQHSRYTVDMELEAQLQASFPKAGDAEIIRELFRSDMGKNRMGVNARRKDDSIYYTYPIAIYTGTKPPIPCT